MNCRRAQAVADIFPNNIHSISEVIYICVLVVVLDTIFHFKTENNNHASSKGRILVCVCICAVDFDLIEIEKLNLGLQKSALALSSVCLMDRLKISVRCVFFLSRSLFFFLSFAK